MTEQDVQRPGVGELQDQLLEQNKEIHRWRAFLESEEWKELAAMAQEQIKLRRDQYELEPGNGMDALVEMNFQRGEISGIRFVVEQPVKALETLEETADSLRQLLQSVEDDDDG